MNGNLWDDPCSLVWQWSVSRYIYSSTVFTVALLVLAALGQWKITWLHLTVCFIQPSGKAPLETVWKRADTMKKYLAGNWINHLSATIYCGLTSTNQIKNTHDQQSHLVNQTLTSCGKTGPSFFIKKSLLNYQKLSKKQQMWIWTHPTAGQFTRFGWSRLPPPM